MINVARMRKMEFDLSLDDFGAQHPNVYCLFNISEFTVDELQGYYF